MARIGAILLRIGLLGIGLLAGCSDSWNNPYTDTDAHANVLYSAFSERPKHLDPARSYSSNEAESRFASGGQKNQSPLASTARAMRVSSPPATGSTFAASG